jgi:hypothetical protein
MVRSRAPWVVVVLAVSGGWRQREEVLFAQGLEGSEKSVMVLEFAAPADLQGVFGHPRARGRRRPAPRQPAGSLDVLGLARSLSPEFRRRGDTRG